MKIKTVKYKVGYCTTGMSWIKSHLWQGTRQQQQQQRKTKSAVGSTELLPRAFGMVICRCWCCYFCIHCHWRWQAFGMPWLYFGLGPQTWYMVVVYCVSKGCHLLCIKGLSFTVCQRVIIYCVSKGCYLLCIIGLWFTVYQRVVFYCVSKVLKKMTLSPLFLWVPYWTVTANKSHAWKWNNWMRWLCVCVDMTGHDP